MLVFECLGAHITFMWSLACCITETFLFINAQLINSQSHSYDRSLLNILVIILQAVDALMHSHHPPLQNNVTFLTSLCPYACEVIILLAQSDSSLTENSCNNCDSESGVSDNGISENVLITSKGPSVFKPHDFGGNYD
jgi:hypothetical protein